MLTELALSTQRDHQIWPQFPERMQMALLMIRNEATDLYFLIHLSGCGQLASGWCLQPPRSTLLPSAHTQVSQGSQKCLAKHLIAQVLDPFQGAVPKLRGMRRDVQRSALQLFLGNCGTFFSIQRAERVLPVLTSCHSANTCSPKAAQTQPNLASSSSFLSVVLGPTTSASPGHH